MDRAKLRIDNLHFIIRVKRISRVDNFIIFWKWVFNFEYHDVYTIIFQLTREIIFASKLITEIKWQYFTSISCPLRIRTRLHYHTHPK